MLMFADGYIICWLMLTDGYIDQLESERIHLTPAPPRLPIIFTCSGDRHHLWPHHQQNHYNDSR